jgi:hypothetical protein
MKEDLVTVFDFCKSKKWIQVPESKVRSYCGFFWLDKDWASNVMETRNTRNRDFSVQATERLKRDVRNKRWMVNNQGIGFNKLGILLDGQKRVAAVAETGLPIEIFVAFGLDNESQDTVDTQQTRTDYDSVVIRNPRKTIKRRMVEIGRYVLESEIGFNPHRLTKQERLSFLDQIKDGVGFAVSALEQVKGGVKLPATVGAAIARAFYSCKNDEKRLDRLREFGRVIKGGPYLDFMEDDSAHRLLVWLIRDRAKVWYSRPETFRRVETAINLFLQKKGWPMRYLPTQEELFPLPESVSEKIRRSVEAASPLKNSKSVSRVKSRSPEEWSEFFQMKVKEILAKTGKLSKSRLKSRLNMHHRSSEVQNIFQKSFSNLLDLGVVEVTGKEKHQTVWLYDTFHTKMNALARESGLTN